MQVFNKEIWSKLKAKAKKPKFREGQEVAVVRNIHYLAILIVMGDVQVAWIKAIEHLQ